MKNIRKCSGVNCPMQVEYDVANCQCEDCSYRTPPMTNYERIKSMSIEQLAKMLDGECQFCAYDGEDCMFNHDIHCEEGCIKWLKNNYEEDDFEVDE